MAPPISVQLYTVREELAKDFEGVIRQIAAMGYVGVETAGFPGTTPQHAVELFKALDLQVPSAHSPLPLGDKKNEVLDTMAVLGTHYLVCPWLDPKQYYSTLDQVKAACDLLNEASVVAHANNLVLAYHNHWFEYQMVEGKAPYEVMLERLNPEVMLEVDTYWVQTAGLDAAQVVQHIGARAPLLHIKDGPCVLEQPMVAVGDGKMDIPKVIGAAGDHAQWLVVELDQCATSMIEAVQKSYTYLTGHKLAHGKH